MQLVISTATAACSVALVDGDTIVAEMHEAVGRGHAERLIPMIAALPHKGRADAILVDCGPGSFTGLRVGLAAARALALAWDVPVHGFSSLALIAVTADGPCAVAIQGGHGELFVQRFSANPLSPSGPIESLPPDRAALAVPDAVVLGSGAAQLVGMRGGGGAIDRLPRAADARRLPPQLRNLPASPLYGRAPDAKPQ